MLKQTRFHTDMSKREIKKIERDAELAQDAFTAGVDRVETEIQKFEELIERDAGLISYSWIGF